MTEAVKAWPQRGYTLYKTDMMSCSRGGLADLYLGAERDIHNVNMLGLRLLFAVVFQGTKKGKVIRVRKVPKGNGSGGG